MDTCFVIQPFDKDKFDNRYKDVYEPAIKNANLEPYRVDNDPASQIAIDDIGRNIKLAKVCFADITINNPNVWYELGYAFALDKNVVMVCSDERDGKYPFDIQHRTIIQYKTGSPSNFKELEHKITEKLLAFQKLDETTKTIIESPIKEQHGLKAHEITLVVFIMENQMIEQEWVSVYFLTQSMEKAGYTKIAVSIAIKQLAEKGYIQTGMQADDYNHNEYYPACRLTEKGIAWVIENQELFNMKTVSDKSASANEGHTDDLPF